MMITNIKEEERPAIKNFLNFFLNNSPKEEYYLF